MRILAVLLALYCLPVFAQQQVYRSLEDAEKAAEETLAEQKPKYDLTATSCVIDGLPPGLGLVHYSKGWCVVRFDKNPGVATLYPETYPEVSLRTPFCRTAMTALKVYWGVE